VWPRYHYSKGSVETARIMTPFLASNVFGSIRSNSITSFCPSLNVHGHCDVACSTVWTLRGHHVWTVGLPVGALNFVKVDNADDLFCFVLNFFVAMRHKFGDGHTAARQELINCFCLFHVFPFGLTARQATPRPSPLSFTTISPSIFPSTPDERAEWPVSCATGRPRPLRKGALTVRRFIGKVSLKWNPF